MNPQNPQDYHIFNQPTPRLRLVGLDLETTGLDVSRDQIVQFAAICEGLDDLDLKINPQCEIPVEASNIHHLTNEALKDAPTFKQLLPQILGVTQLATQPGSALFGYRVRQFDWPMLQSHLATEGFVGPTPMIIDVYDLMCWAHREQPSRKLSDMVALYDLSFNGDAHNAVVDIHATHAILGAFRYATGIPDTFAGDMQLARIATLAAIRCDAEYSAFGRYLYRDRATWGKPDNFFRLGFGKHCGEPLEALAKDQPGYCRWLVSNVVPSMPEAAQRVIRQAWSHLFASPAV